MPIENSSLYKIAHSDSDAKLGSCCAAICDRFNTITGGPRMVTSSSAMVDALAVTSCLIDGEAVACDADGLALFERLRGRRHDASVFLYAFDLIELDGTDLRREPLQVRKATLASLLKRAAPGLRLNEHIVVSSPPRLLRLLPAGAKVAGWVCSPLGDRAFTAHVEDGSSNRFESRLLLCTCRSVRHSRSRRCPFGSYQRRLSILAAHVVRLSAMSLGLSLCRAE